MMEKPIEGVEHREEQGPDRGFVVHPVSLPGSPYRLAAELRSDLWRLTAGKHLQHLPIDDPTSEQSYDQFTRDLVSFDDVINRAMDYVREPTVGAPDDANRRAIQEKAQRLKSFLA